MNPLLSSQSFSLDLEAMGKFLSVLSSALFVRVQFLKISVSHLDSKVLPFDPFLTF